MVKRLVNPKIIEFEGDWSNPVKNSDSYNEKLPNPIWRDVFRLWCSLDFKTGSFPFVHRDEIRSELIKILKQNPRNPFVDNFKEDF